MPTLRIALLTIRLVMRTKVALFFTFLFPLVFLFAYAGLIAHGNPNIVAYMFGPVVTLNIMGSGFFGLGMQSVMQRERGSLRRYRLAPISPRTILLSNLHLSFRRALPPGYQSWASRFKSSVAAQYNGDGSLDMLPACRRIPSITGDNTRTKLRAVPRRK